MLLGCSWHLQRFFFFFRSCWKICRKQELAAVSKIARKFWKCARSCKFCSFWIVSRELGHIRTLARFARSTAAFRLPAGWSDCEVVVTSPSQWRHEWRERGIYRCVRKACCYIRCRLRCVCPLKCNTLNSRRKLWGHRVGVGWRLFGSDLVLCEPLDASITCGTTDILRKK